MHQYKPGDFGVPHDDFEGAQVSSSILRRDAYDGDHDTVSPYDDMEQRAKFDWGVPAGEPGSKSPWSLQQKHSKDMYDGDKNTVSQYDSDTIYKKFDWGVPAGQPGSKSAHS